MGGGHHPTGAMQWEITVHDDNQLLFTYNKDNKKMSR